MTKSILLAAASLLAISTGAHAAAFVNGGFENGTSSGWITGTGDRSSIGNDTIAPSQFLPGGSQYTGPGGRSSVIGTGYVDPRIGAALGSTVYSGNFSYRVEDTTFGGYASVISQTVTNYTDPSIFFAWKAVLENGGHPAVESAVMQIALTDVTTNTVLVSRIYDAGGGTDTRFSSFGNLFYTSAWQIEQIDIDASRAGHTFTLSVLAADCEPTGHTGYVYLDGFGATTPPPVDPGTPVPEPASLGLFGIGLVGLLGARRKARKTAA